MNMERIVTSVLILIVHQDGIAVFKCKSQTPVAVDANRPVTRKAAFERVPVPARTVHVFGGIQRRPVPRQARSVCGLDPSA